MLLVIEARAVSGSLITVDQALEQGRDVLALPGRLGDPLSEGCNNLIRQGAGILTCTEDALQLLGMAAPDGAEKKAKGRRGDSLSPAQKTLYRVISHDPQHLEDLMRQTGFGLGEISLLLLSLEEAGLIRPVSGSSYVRI